MCLCCVFACLCFVGWYPQPLTFAFQVQVGVQGFVLGYQRVPHIDAGKGLGFRVKKLLIYFDNKNTLEKFSCGSKWPENWVLRLLVIVMVAQVWGRYVIIGDLGP